MRESTPVLRPADPKLPWYGTVILLALVFVVALVKPLAPHGALELVRRIAGISPSLAIGNGRTLRLIEQRTIDTNCQAMDLEWSPGGTALVTDCWSSILAWTPEGRLLGSIATPGRPLLAHVQVLGNPLRVVFVGGTPVPGGGHGTLTVWDVKERATFVQPDPFFAVSNFTVDQGQPRVAVTYRDRSSVSLLSLADWHTEQTIHIPRAIWTMRWIPSADELLLGSFDGVLFSADVSTGSVKELARPYAATAGDRSGPANPVDGLVLSPNGKAVATYMTFNAGAVGIWSTGDGRLVSRIQRRDDRSIQRLVWDPLDRFLATSSSDGLVLCALHEAAHSVIGYGDNGSIHGLAVTADGSLVALSSGDRVRIFRIEEQSGR